MKKALFIIILVFSVSIVSYFTGCNTGPETVNVICTILRETVTNTPTVTATSPPVPTFTFTPTPTPTVTMTPTVTPTT